LSPELEEFLFLLPDAFLEVDLETRRVTYLNRIARTIFGYQDDDLGGGLDCRLVFPEGEFERARQAVESSVGQPAPGDADPLAGHRALYEFQMRRRDGSLFSAEVQSSFVLDDTGTAVGMRSIVRDISDRKELERQLAEMSLRDPLTGCYNRRFLERCRPELERPTARWACLVFDLKDFKSINDTYGHEEGDRVLRSFVHFLGRHHRTEDILVRLGGDEFGLILHAASEAEAKAISGRLLEASALDSPAGFSMGMVYRRSSEGLEAALSRADRVMYASRGQRLRSKRPKP
jgi:diguanylate cyclase (GGDEF)-like protein/PAS domain S-box-containing protein